MGCCSSVYNHLKAFATLLRRSSFFSVLIFMSHSTNCFQKLLFCFDWFCEGSARQRAVCLETSHTNSCFLFCAFSCLLSVVSSFFFFPVFQFIKLSSATPCLCYRCLLFFILLIKDNKYDT